MEQIFERIGIPKLWSERPNPLIEHCHQWSCANAIRLEVISNKNKIIQRFHDQKFSLLTALAYPHADEERITIINDFLSYLFFNDDGTEQNEDVGKQITKLVPIFTAHVRAIEDGVIENPCDPLCGYLADIRERMLKYVSHRWLRRFARNVEDYLMKGTLVAAQNWMLGQVPTFHKYEEQRKYDSALFTSHDLIELSEGFELPDEIYYRYEIQTLNELSNLVVSYTNDLFSYHKEVNVFSSPNNIVHVVMTHEKLPLRKAVHEVVDMINTKVASFAELEKKLPRWDDRTDKMVSLYLKGQKTWMRGNLDWSVKSKRYHSPDSPFVELRQGSFEGSDCLTDASSWDAWR